MALKYERLESSLPPPSVHFEHSDSPSRDVQRGRSSPHRFIRVCRSSTVPWSLLFLCIAFIIWRHTQQPSEIQCTRRLSTYSPVIEQGAVQYYDTDFANTFAHKTEYRGPPSLELEVAWNKLWHRGAIEIPKENISKLNRSGEKLAHAHGDDARGYRALLEVFHQLHCLNIIRQYTWWDYYQRHPSDWTYEGRRLVTLNVSGPPQIGDRMHVDHCIETLRLTLMCFGDVTPLLMVIDNMSDAGFAADFNTHHKCRNFEKIVEWQEMHNSDSTKQNK